MVALTSYLNFAGGRHGRNIILIMAIELYLTRRLIILIFGLLLFSFWSNVFFIIFVDRFWLVGDSPTPYIVT